MRRHLTVGNVLFAATVVGLVVAVYVAWGLWMTVGAIAFWVVVIPLFSNFNFGGGYHGRAARRQWERENPYIAQKARAKRRRNARAKYRRSA